MDTPLEQYLNALRARLSVSKEDEDAIMEEVLSHLEERTESLRAGGMSDEAAQRVAVHAFGTPRRIARRFEATHPIVWTRRRFVLGALRGAGWTWAVWLLVTIPFVAQILVSQVAFLPPLRDPQPWWALPLLVLVTSTPLTPAVGSLAVLFSGVLAHLPTPMLDVTTRLSTAVSFGIVSPLWMVPLFVAFAIIPFRWGGRTHQWKRAGVAYGLGAWLSTIVPLLVLTFVGSVISGFTVPESIFAVLLSPVMLVLRYGTYLLLLPVALVASNLGHRARFNAPRRAVVAG